MQVSVWSLSLASQTLVNFSVSQSTRDAGSLPPAILCLPAHYLSHPRLSLLLFMLLQVPCVRMPNTVPPGKLSTPCFFFSGMFVPRNPCDSVPYLLWSLTNCWAFREASSVHPVPNGTPSLAFSLLARLCFIFRVLFHFSLLITL